MTIKKRLLKACPKRIKKRLRKLNQPFKAIFYRANMILFPKRTIWFCPCCGMKFKFFTSGDFRSRPKRYNPHRYEQTRQDVLCPYCGALHRHRILAAWCENQKDLLQSSQILYFAPEHSMEHWMKRNRIACT